MLGGLGIQRKELPAQIVAGRSNRVGDDPNQHFIDLDVRRRVLETSSVKQSGRYDDQKRDE